MNLQKWIYCGLFCGVVINPIITEASSYKTPGEIFLEGELLDSPCEIEYQDREQLLEFGPVTVHDIRNRSGGYLSLPVEIRLSGCTLASRIYPEVLYSTVKVTFKSEQVAENGQLIGIVGEASGFGIRLSDLSGNIITSGMPSVTYPLTEGINTLRFLATLVPTSSNIKSGEFYANVRFSMEYL